jgi:Ribbon-helix-helix protein, copG family
VQINERPGLLDARFRGHDEIEYTRRSLVVEANRQKSEPSSVVRISVYLSKKELAAVRKAATRSGRSMSELVRAAIRAVALKQEATGFVGIWNGEMKRTSFEHDSVYDEP